MCPQFGGEFTGELNTTFVVWLHFRPYIRSYNICIKSNYCSLTQTRPNQQWGPEVFMGDHSFEWSTHWVTTHWVTTPGTDTLFLKSEWSLDRVMTYSWNLDDLSMDWWSSLESEWPVWRVMTLTRPLLHKKIAQISRVGHQSLEWLPVKGVITQKNLWTLLGTGTNPYNFRYHISSVVF